MEPDTILVAALTAGVVALIVWFEINSRRNEERMKRELDFCHRVEPESEAGAQIDTKQKKAA